MSGNSDSTPTPSMGTGPEDRPAVAVSTEDGPAAIGWLEPEVDRALTGLGLPADRLRSFRDSYIDCLASAPRGQDLDAAHDACRRGLLDALRPAFGLDAETSRRLELALEAVEAMLTEDLS